MERLTAQPRMLKQVNLSLIRRVLQARGTVTRGEITRETQISPTTVRSLLAQLIASGEIEGIGYDTSSGGRKAERYQLRLDRYYGAAFCITGDSIHALLVDLRGEVVEQRILPPHNGDFLPAIMAFLDEWTARKDIRSIGVGAPGIVDGGGFLRLDQEGGCSRTAIADPLAARYGIPVVLENDLNAITLGFGRCYERTYPKLGPEQTNMALLYFAPGCVSAGFMVSGRLVRGWNNFAGEVGLIPVEGEDSLDQLLAQEMDDGRYARLVIQIIAWISGILNPEYIAVGGPAFRKTCLGAISNGLYGRLPDPMFAEVVDAGDIWHDYYEGMAALTADKMFDTVALKKETI